MNIDAKAIWQALDEVKDPEIPVISLVALGVVRDVAISGPQVMVTLTPTFSGCPAFEVMQREVIERLQQSGIEQVEIKIALSPPWSSDWISETGRRQLKAFGLAPPPRHSGQVEIVLLDTVACPFCDATNTTLKNSFGSTLCRAIYYCQTCQQAFEQFKPL